MRGLIKKGIDWYLDLKSFKTEHPVVVIESDDWGSLRTKDKQTRAKLNQIDPTLKNDPYTQLDSIATQEDLEALFEVLNSVKDRNGNPACMTANVCTANPDFEAIKANDYETFVYKPFTKTLEEFSTRTSLFSIWQKGIQEKLFVPQLHGREHVHGLAWLAELKAGNKDLLKAFELETWGIPYKALTTQRRSNLQATLDYYGIEGEEEYQRQWIIDSVRIFQEAFGVRPKSFIPPAYTWHKNIHHDLNNAGIKLIQGMKLQYQPNHNDKTSYKRIPHYIGQIDKDSELVYTTRNAFFEPYSADYTHVLSQNELVNITMNAVHKAIAAKKPVIIGSHRINYIGRIDRKYRDNNLETLKLILKQIVNKYPDVEFVDSGKLVEIILINNTL